MATRDFISTLIDTEMNRFILKEMLEVNEGAYLYIVRCSDGSLYIGTTRTALEIRIALHNDGTFEGYTRSRRPVVLVFAQWFDRITDAIENERKLKKWTRAKKEAFIRGDIASLQVLARRRTPHPSRRAQECAPQDKDSPSS
jgi:putative endonuclease